MPTKPPSPSDGDTIREALAQLYEVVLDGLRHGHFDCLVTAEVVQGRKRRLVIRSGKSYQFTIPEDDLQKAPG